MGLASEKRITWLRWRNGGETVAKRSNPFERNKCLAGISDIRLKSLALVVKQSFELVVNRYLKEYLKERNDVGRRCEVAVTRIWNFQVHVERVQRTACSAERGRWSVGIEKIVNEKVKEKAANWLREAERKRRGRRKKVLGVLGKELSDYS